MAAGEVKNSGLSQTQDSGQPNDRRNLILDIISESPTVSPLCGGVLVISRAKTHK